MRRGTCKPMATARILADEPQRGRVAVHAWRQGRQDVLQEWYSTHTDSLQHCVRRAAIYCGGYSPRGAATDARSRHPILGVDTKHDNTTLGLPTIDVVYQDA